MRTDRPEKGILLRIPVLIRLIGLTEYMVCSKLLELQLVLLRRKKKVGTRSPGDGIRIPTAGRRSEQHFTGQLVLARNVH
jgi:hypothetical protein